MLREHLLTLDPGWVKNQDPDPGPGSGIRIWDQIICPRAQKLKYLNFLMRIRIQDLGIFLSLDPGSGMEKIQHWFFV
jgi:hypothetical protein